MSDVALAYAGAPGTWRWRCPDSDQPWHFTLEDQGFAASEQTARELWSAHVRDFHEGQVHVICDQPVPGRLSMRCNQLEGHLGSHWHVNRYFKAFGSTDG